jgi:hypothetical protein
VASTEKLHINIPPSHAPGEMRIAVVGAGPAGMAMAKQVQDNSRGQGVEIVLFERRQEVGGIWQYEEPTQPGRFGWEHSDGSISEAVEKPAAPGRRMRLVCGDGKTWRVPGPMFDGLRTNIPNDLMTFRDSPFPHDVHLFPARHQVQTYLEEYATRHDLRRHIRFSTLVTRIVKDESSDGWLVESHELGKAESARSEWFSHVVLAHGRCSTPNMPQIPGIETFNGRVMHSAWYRDPATLFQPGEKKRVLVVGNMSSGMDVARELSGYIKRTLPCGKTAERWQNDCLNDPIDVYSSWHSAERPPPADYNPLDPESPDWCRRINVVDNITSVQGSKINFADGSSLDDIALIILATGYLYDCPFLDQTKGALRRYPLLPPSTGKTRAGFPSSSMYNMDDWLLMHSHDETLAVLGVPILVVPFPFSEVQAAYVINRWLGKAVKLPLLDTSFGVDEEERWTSRRAEHPITNGHVPNDADEVVLDTVAPVFRAPCEHIYLNALLSFFGAGQTPSWHDEYTSNGLGDGQPRYPEHLYAISPWRRERRSNGKTVRRATLGY